MNSTVKHGVPPVFGARCADLTTNAADVFGSGRSSEQVATDWYHKYQQDDAEAVTELVNCILQAAGCDQHVTADDVRDPDNCQNRIADLQNVYTDASESPPDLD